MFTKKMAVVENSNYSLEGEEGELTVDVYADGGDIVIETLIAGLDPDDLDISIAHDLVTIKGARKKNKEIPGKNYYYQECFYGEFSRTILLPTDIDPDKAKANFSKNGVLTIVMPKVEQKLTSKKLTVKSEGEEETSLETKSRRWGKVVEEKEEIETIDEPETVDQETQVISSEKDSIEVEESSDKDWALLSPRPMIKRKTRSSRDQ